MKEFYKSKSVFITGHTGFKGAWLCEVLRLLGADVTGYALPCVNGGVYNILNIDSRITSNMGDVQDYTALEDTFNKAKPEIVFHLAAQPLVLDSYERPGYTFNTNVQGTVNLLECVRQSDSVKSVVVVTTDKVYRNQEWVYGYREDDILGGSDPYSASKACAEIIADSYAKSFLCKLGIVLSTARAGNVIGGGDISPNRIIPDCIRSASGNVPIIIRNRHSVRPYQHVLEPLFAYLLIAQKQYENAQYSGYYNIGPAESDCVTTAELADIFCNEWGGASWRDVTNPNAPHESGLLKLDCSKIRSVLGWRPCFNLKEAVAKTIEWEKSGDKEQTTLFQIREYLERMK